MSDDTEIGVVVEADATAAVHAVGDAADVFVRLIGTVQGLEQALQRVFTDVIPNGVQKIESMAEAMRSLGPLAAQLETSPTKVASPRQLNQVAQRLSTGGPVTQMRTALERGVTSTISTDPSLQAARLEAAEERRLAAREEQYRRARSLGGSDAEVLAAYRGRLNNIGDNYTRRGHSQEEWEAETEREVRTFNERMAEQIGQTYQRAMKRSMPQIFAVSDEAERDARARSVADRYSSYAQRRGVDIRSDDLYGVYENEAFDRMGRDAVNSRQAEQAQEQARVRAEALQERSAAAAEDRQRTANERAAALQERSAAVAEDRQRTAAQEALMRNAREGVAGLEAEETARLRDQQSRMMAAARQEDRERQAQGRREYGDASFENRQYDRSYVGADRLMRQQASWMDSAPAEAARYETQIVRIEQQINTLREKGNATEKERITLLEQEIARLRQLQERYLQIGGASEAAAVARARATPIQTGPRNLDAEAQQAVERRLALRRAQMEYQGGAPMFGVEMHTMANYAVMGGAIGAAGYAGKQVLDFQSGLEGIKAEAGATDGEMSALARDIMAVGASSNNSLKDLTDATDQLVKAGYSVKEASALLTPVGQLATATKASVKDAADVVGEMMKTFSLAADQGPQISNAIAEIATKSKVSLEDIGKATKASGQFAVGAGMQPNEVLAAYGAMANSGVKDGSQIGSGLKALIEALDNPTKKLQEQLSKVGLMASQVSVESNGLGGALENLQKHGFTAADAMSGLQARAFQAFNALYSNIDVYNKLDHTVLTSSAAADQAGQRMQSFEASWQRLLNVMSAFAYEGAAPVLHMLTGLMTTTAGVVGVLNKAGPAVAVFGTALSSLAIAAAVTYLAKLAGGFLEMIPASAQLTLGFTAAAVAEGDFAAASAGAAVALRAVGAAMLASPVGLLAAGLTVLSLAYEAVSMAAGHSAAMAEQAGQAAQTEADKQNDLKDRLSQLDGFIGSLIERHDELASKTNGAGREAEIAMQRFGQFGLTLDTTGTHVDGLIGRLNQLRVATQQAMVESMKRERGDLGDEQNQLNRQLNGATPLSTRGRLQAQLALGAGSFGLRGDAATYAQAIQRGDEIDPNKIDAMVNAFRKAGRNDLVQTLQDSSGTVKKLGQTRSQIGDLDAQLPTAEAAVTPQAQAFQQRQQSELLRLHKRMADVAAMPAGADRIKAQGDLQKDAANTYSSLQGDASKLGGRNVAANLLNTSAANSIGQLGNVEHPGMSQREWASRASALLMKARKSGSKEDWSAYENAYIAAHPDMTDSELEDLQTKDGIQQGSEADRNGRRAAAAGRRADGNEASTTGKDMADLLKEMQSTAALAPDRQAVQPQLQKMGTDYVSMARSQATDQGKRQQLSGDQLQRAVDDAVDKANEEIVRVIEGNASAAAKAVADAAERSADTKAGTLNLAASMGKGGDPVKALQEIQGAYAKAAAARVDELTTKFEAEFGMLKPGQPLPATLADQIAESNEKFTKTTSKALLEQLDAIYEGAQETTRKSFQGQRQGIAQQRAQLSAVGNDWGDSHLGDTYKWMTSQAQNTLNIQDARVGVSEAQAYSNDAKTSLAQKQKLYAADPQNDNLAKAVEEAQKKVEATNQALSEAKSKLTELTTTGEDFASVSSAIAASWAKASADLKLDESPLQRLSDGFSNQIQNADQSFASFINNLTSGTMKGSQAFKQLGVSLFQSLEQAAAKALADSAIKYLISLGSSFIGGGTGVPGASMIDTSGLASIPTGNLWQGGPIRQRFTQGGVVQGDVNTRDSQPILTAPGEGVLNQDAMSMIGEAGLNALNSAGNRQQSMPTVQQAVPKQAPQSTNVYVVAPSYQPPPSPRDIVATISNDIMTGGTTKQLIKAVVNGQA